MNTRSRGTSTSSKITNASCSSKRDDSGRSKCLAPGVDTGSRHRNTRPGVSIGIEKLSAYSGGASGRERMPGIDGDLVGERCERGEDAGAAHDDPVLGIAGLVQRDRVVDEFGVGRPVDRRMDDGVGERDVLERQLALEGDEVGMALDVRAVRALPTTRVPRRNRRTSRSCSRGCGPSAPSTSRRCGPARRGGASDRPSTAGSCG